MKLDTLEFGQLACSFPLADVVVVVPWRVNTNPAISATPTARPAHVQSCAVPGACTYCRISESG